MNILDDAIDWIYDVTVTWNYPEEARGSNQIVDEWQTRIVVDESCGFVPPPSHFHPIGKYIFSQSRNFFF